MANSVPSKPTEWCFDSRYCELRTVGSPTHFDLNRHRHDRHHRPQVENLIAVHFLFFFVCETPSSPTPHPPVHSPIAATETENLNTGNEHSAPDFSDLTVSEQTGRKAEKVKPRTCLLEAEPVERQGAGFRPTAGTVGLSVSVTRLVDLQEGQPASRPLPFLVVGAWPCCAYGVLSQRHWVRACRPCGDHMLTGRLAQCTFQQ